MRLTDEEIERAGARFEQFAEEPDPASAKILATEHVGGVAEAAQDVRDNETRLREAPEPARAHGRSWNHTAAAPGTSRRAARQRFADTVRTSWVEGRGAVALRVAASPAR
jgi:hypothetical protein